MDQIKRKCYGILIQSSGDPVEMSQRLSENLGSQLFTCRDIDEASQVFSEQGGQVRYIFVSTEFGGTTGFQNLLGRVKLVSSNVVFVLFDPDAPTALHSLLSDKNPVSTANVRPKNAQESVPLVGKSDQLAEVLHLAERYARHDITVLITGETGTGKELFAKYIHDHSPRQARPFVACNLAAVSETLLESELFGYTKGAFTGADKDKKGFLEEAEGGTLFLDEIGDLPQTIQVKLLRFLESREYYKVGDAVAKTANVRIVAATNSDLDQANAGSGFRTDLYYRLNAARIILPPLRERKADIMPLAQSFIAGACNRFGIPMKTVTSSINVLLAEYSWPGNIRELKNVIESAVMVSDTDVLVMADLPMHIQDYAITDRDNIGAKAITKVKEAERELIKESLRRWNGNRVATAKSLGISTRTLYRKLDKFGSAPAGSSDRQPATLANRWAYDSNPRAAAPH